MDNTVFMDVGCTLLWSETPSFSRVVGVHNEILHFLFFSSVGAFCIHLACWPFPIKHFHAVWQWQQVQKSAWVYFLFPALRQALRLGPDQRHWHCHYWHFIDSSQNVEAKAKCLLYQESHAAWKLHYGKPWSRRAAAGLVGNNAIVCTSVRKRLHESLSRPAFGKPKGLRWGTLTNKYALRTDPFRTCLNQACFSFGLSRFHAVKRSILQRLSVSVWCVSVWK